LAHYGSFRDAKGEVIDSGIALFFPSPHSYTGEDVLELQAHGGPVVLDLLLARCLEAAATINPISGKPVLAHLRLARPGEFTQRAFLNGKLDLAQAEAVSSLIDASSAVAARSASRSLSGGFSKVLYELRDSLIELRMLVEATLDFPEEEIDTLSDYGVSAKLIDLQRQLRDVGVQARQGALLAEGIRIVIAGQPNAGKSSLLNALAGQDVAIVTPVAGTTRDALVQSLLIDGIPLHVTDTAGLRTQSASTDDPIERIGIERAWQHIQNADAVLFLHDLTRVGDAAYQIGDSDIQTQLTKALSVGATVLHVWNKSDAAAVPIEFSFKSDGFLETTPVVISARTGAGLDVLRKRLLELAGWQGGSGEGLFLARQRHVHALRQASEHLSSAAAHLSEAVPLLELIAEDLRLAQNELGSITGEFGADDLLGVIFERFCMGK
jgi:tRNA modification GTPase